MEYTAKADRIEKEALKIRANTPAWTHFKTQSNVHMYYKPSPHFNGNMYKFVSEMSAPYEIVYQVMRPPKTTQERLSWDKSLKHYERLLTITDDLAIGVLITPTAAMGIVSKREFIDLYVFKTYPEDELNEEYGEICWIFAESVEYPSRPVSKDYVRGTNYPAGYAVAQNKKDPGKCFLEFYINCDIGGMIPRSVVEVALPSQQLSYLQSIKDEVARRMK